VVVPGHVGAMPSFGGGLLLVGLVLGVCATCLPINREDAMINKELMANGVILGMGCLAAHELMCPDCWPSWGAGHWRGRRGGVHHHHHHHHGAGTGVNMKEALVTDVRARLLRPGACCGAGAPGHANWHATIVESTVW
jgi:hypothetical protein